MTTVPPSVSTASEFRTRSELIKRYPWATTRVLSAQCFTSYLPLQWQEFARHLERTENEIMDLTLPSSQSIMSDLQFPDADLRPGNKRSLPRSTAYMASLRLLDVLSSAYGGCARPPVPRQIHFQPSKWKHASALDSIKGLLSAFRSIQLGKLSLVDIAAADHAAVQHLTSLVFYKNVKSVSKIFINMILAALYLGFCLSGHADFKQYANKYRESIHGPDRKDIDKLLNRDAMYLRRPLYVALHLSPIILLSPRHEIDSQCPYNELDMLEDAIVLGNHTVEPLKQAEQLIWQCLFYIASGKIRVEDAVRMLQTRLPFDDLLALSDDQDQALRLTHLNAVAPTAEDSSMDVEDHDTIPPIPSFQIGTVTPVSDTEMTDGTAETSSDQHIASLQRYPIAETSKMQDGAQPDTRFQAPEVVNMHSTQRPIQNYTFSSQSDEDGNSTEDHDGSSSQHSDGNSQADSGGRSPEDVDNSASNNVPKYRWELRALPPIYYKLKDAKLPQRQRKSRSNPNILPPTTLTPFPQMITTLTSGEDRGIEEISKLAIAPLGNDHYLIRMMTAWDAYGVQNVFKPVIFDNSRDCNFFQELIQTAASRTHSLVALHASENYTKSVFRIMSYQDYSRLSSREMQSIFRNHHIVVKDVPTPKAEFNTKGVSSITNIRRTIKIKDASVCDGAAGPDTEGSLLDLLSCSRFPYGKGLTSIQIPSSDSTQECGHPLSTDTRAFHTVSYEPEGRGNFTMPLAQIKWSQISTHRAVSHNQITSDGVATMIDVLTGVKALVVVRSLATHNPYSFSNCTQFDSENFEPDEGFFHQSSRWGVEIILLTPGTRLFMRPNTIHASLTMAHSICQGGNFYTLSTIRDTLAALTHTLSHQSLITSTNYPDLRLMARRVVQYVHMNLVLGENDEDDNHCFDGNNMTKQDFEDICGVISIGVLGNILDPRTYSVHPGANDGEVLSPFDLQRTLMYDYNSLPQSERSGYVYTRGAAFELIEWFCERYTLNNVNKNITTSTIELLYDSVAHGAVAAYCSILATRKRGNISSPNVTPAKIRHQIEYLSEEETLLWYGTDDFLANPDCVDNILYDWTDFEVVKKKDARSHFPWSVEEIFKNGQTPLDRRYFFGLKNGFTCDGSFKVPV